MSTDGSKWRACVSTRPLRGQRDHYVALATAESHARGAGNASRPQRSRAPTGRCTAICSRSP
eukprot:373425-Lingulodinium_polyedra.AAC.1